MKRVWVIKVFGLDCSLWHSFVLYVVVMSLLSEVGGKSKGRINTKTPLKKLQLYKHGVLG